MAGFTLEQLNAGRGGGAAQKKGFTLESLNAERSQYRKDYDERLRNYRDAEPVYRNGKPAYKSRNEAFRAIAQQILDTAGETAYNEFRAAALGALKDDARNAVLRRRYDRLVTSEYDRLDNDKSKSVYLEKAVADRGRYRVNEFDELLRHYDPSVKVEDKGAEFAFDRGVDPHTIVTSDPRANGLGVKRNPLEDNPYLTGPQETPDSSPAPRKASMSIGDGVNLEQIAAIDAGRREGIRVDPIGIVTGKRGARYVSLDGTEREVTDRDRENLRAQNRAVNYDPDLGYVGM